MRIVSLAVTLRLTHQQTIGQRMPADCLHPPRLLSQLQLGLSEVRGQFRGRRQPPELDGLVLRPSGQEAVIKRRKGKVGDNVGVTLDLSHCAPVLPTGGI